MKHTGIFLVPLFCFLFLAQATYGGGITYGLHISATVDTQHITKYKIPKATSEDEFVCVLHMKYGEATVMNPEAAEPLKHAGTRAYQVDLVYTNFRKQDVQDMLNRKRLVELYFLTPYIFGQETTQWNLIEQTSCKSETEAAGFFHGVVIRYGKATEFSATTPRDIKESALKTVKRDSSMFPILDKTLKDPNTLICVDLTGSMSPYYLQVFGWLMLKAKKNTYQYSFFNDGDDKYDYDKKAGNTGGVYVFKTDKIDTVVKKVLTCISKGNGGDAPENNVEAVIKASRVFKKITRVQMVADNWANMRDYSMMDQIKVPVDVILCGTGESSKSSPVNTQYLDLARRTGGTFRTMEQELQELSKMQEGDKVQVQGYTYVLKGNRFVRL